MQRFYAKGRAGHLASSSRPPGGGGVATEMLVRGVTAMILHVPAAALCLFFFYFGELENFITAAKDFAPQSASLLALKPSWNAILPDESP